MNECTEEELNNAKGIVIRFDKLFPNNSFYISVINLINKKAGLTRATYNAILRAYNRKEEDLKIAVDKDEKRYNNKTNKFLRGHRHRNVKITLPKLKCLEDK